MIAKAKSCVGGTALFNYVIDSRKGYELLRNNLSGETPKDMFQTMQILQNQNSRCKNNTISAVISPTITDSQKMSDRDLRILAFEFLLGLQIDPTKAQYIAFVHTEKEHKHIHIIANRIDENGKALKDNYIGFEAQRVAHEIALKYDWTSIRQENENKKQRANNTNLIAKNAIKSGHREVLRQKPKGLQEYIYLMLEKEIEVKPSVNKQGNIQGYRFIHLPTNTNLKASEVDRNMKLNDLFKNTASTEPSDEVNKSLTNQKSSEIQMQNWKTDTSVLFSMLSALQFDGNDEDDEKKKRKRRILKR
ncbi:relaxase/mobilization nuclease domain-containing protein [Myroides odoratimimus]|uniref:Mobilization protein n=1 Tax=Myroides marinus TaxID=703342 RepID=A0A163X193_9FLAO|nr:MULTISPECIES: relaxase/mobilization nuclease domain-containing protein [Myroides]KZE77157.1 mobilization protein [Myroides marinus]MDM1468332.1 relaxase/mobilization nuclease domain-containing protein [Myroides odoratimimus]MDM1471827.1 relaxase/mobilization nuclease domain-containing protein [Myroides odoratimimus]MDM1481887.1 relaxase/mobilization nuclease domain-containing protein [Myroides odoratimimus]QBK77461.1 mobilization protein [Myroides odoratimimus]